MVNRIECLHCDKVFGSTYQLERHLMEVIDDRDAAIMMMGKAVAELDTIAYSPPSLSTQQMISRVKNILLKK